jgi:hypothetical protein
MNFFPWDFKFKLKSEISCNFELQSLEVTLYLLYEDESVLGYSTVYSASSGWFTLMIEAVHTSEMSVYSETTWCCIKEGYHLHTCCHENHEIS